MSGKKILWLTPNKPDNISVGRQRIATHIEDSGHTVVLRGTTWSTVAHTLRDGGYFDVIIGTTRAGAIAGAVAAQIYSVPLLVDHVDPIRQFRQTDRRTTATIIKHLENVAFRVADHVVYVYSEEAPRVEKYATTSTQTTLGVDYERFYNPSSEAVSPARERIGNSTNQIVVYIGGLEPMYSIGPMLESIDYLDGFRLIVIGTGTLESQVEEAAENSDSIQFIGTVPHEHIPGYLHHSDVGLSLVDDPHTLKVLEYGAAGLPVVQLKGRTESRFGGLLEYTTANPANIASAIKRATVSDSGPALQKYVRQFDWANVAKVYVDLISGLH